MNRTAFAFPVEAIPAGWQAELAHAPQSSVNSQLCIVLF